MMETVGHRCHGGACRTMNTAMNAEGPMRGSNKMNAIGHQAKAAVVVAREAGVDLPNNAQGIAASGLARGVDAAALFASLVTPDDPVMPDDPVVPDDPVLPDDPDVSDPVAPVPDDPDTQPDGSQSVSKSLAVPVQDAPPELALSVHVTENLLADLLPPENDDGEG